MRRSLSQDGLAPPFVLVFALGFGCTNQGGGASAGDGPPQSGQDAGMSSAPEAGDARDVATQDAAVSRAPDDSGTAGCPMTRPASASECPAGDAGSCLYSEAVCACYPSRLFLPDGGISSREVWGCTPLPPAPCPRSVPADGAPCDREGLRCNYDVRPCASGNPSLHVCDGGVWRIHATPCSSSGGGLPDAGPPSCASTFAAAVAKDCSSAADCVLVDGDDCCGTVKIAIKAGTEASFAAAEAAYLACVPGCGLRGCFHADVAEEGGTPGAGQGIFSECRGGRCLSVVRNTPASCSSNSDCGADRLCVSFVTNVGPTSMTTRQCRPNPCSSAQLACTCAGSLCTAPTSICSVRGDQVICEDGRQ
jgi:hypothetical protein